MQRIGLLLVILAVGFGVWYLVSEDTPPPVVDDNAETSAVDGTAGNPGGLKSADAAGSSVLPQLHKITKSTRVLLIGKHQNSWAELTVHCLQQIRDLEYRTWYTADVKTNKGAAGVGRGMKELKGQPTAEYLLNQDVEALFLDALDPNSLPDAFWKVVTERVASGRMGLFFRPAYLVGPAGDGVTQHPALTHPALMALLPVARAALLQGSPLPGVYSEAQSLRVTTAGMAHPATRMVENRKASGRAWARTANGDGAFATKFCYPVLELKPGAQTLVELEAATPVPAVVVAKDGAARVLWMGNVDFGQRAYFVRSKDAIQKLLVNHWILWLTGE